MKIEIVISVRQLGMVDSAQVPLIQVQVHRGDGQVVLGLGPGPKLHKLPTIDSAQVP